MSCQLVLLRHGESLWNKENLFTGWTDTELSDTGREKARDAGRQLRARGYAFDVCYTSYLKRAIHTLYLTLEELDMEWLPIYKDWRLNERHYGALQGLNKAETAQKYGEVQVKIWRRSFDVRPSKLDPQDERNPARQRAYQGVEAGALPLTESLKDTIARVVPYFEAQIRPQLAAGKRVLIAAHGNSLRALVMYLEHLSESGIVDLNLPTGVPLIYKLGADLSVERKELLGDPAVVEAKMRKVANQGNAQRR